MAIPLTKKQTPRDIALHGSHYEFLLIPLNLALLAVVVFVDAWTGRPGEHALESISPFKILAFVILFVVSWVCRTLSNRNKALLDLIDTLETRVSELEGLSS